MVHPSTSQAVRQSVQLLLLHEKPEVLVAKRLIKRRGGNSGERHATAFGVRAVQSATFSAVHGH